MWCGHRGRCRNHSRSELEQNCVHRIFLITPSTSWKSQSKWSLDCLLYLQLVPFSCSSSWKINTLSYGDISNETDVVRYCNCAVCSGLLCLHLNLYVIVVLGLFIEAASCVWLLKRGSMILLFSLAQITGHSREQTTLK